MYQVYNDRSYSGKLITEYFRLDEENKMREPSELISSVKYSIFHERIFLYRYVSREFRPLECHNKRE